MKDVLAVVLAGGRGERLGPLTRDRAKPAVPFGGIYRIIDFTLSNCLNSGVRRILVLTQYKAMSLDRHITLGWRNYLCRELGEFIDVVPPQQRIDEQVVPGHRRRRLPEHLHARKGAARVRRHPGRRPHLQDGLRQAGRVPSGEERRPDDRRPARAGQRSRGTSASCRSTPTAGSSASRRSRPSPRRSPATRSTRLASMGIYVFNAPVPVRPALPRRDAAPTAPTTSAATSSRRSSPRAACIAFPFLDENRKQDAYWRDVGTIDSYYQANIELTGVEPQLNLYDDHWPVRTYQPNLPPPKFVFNSKDRCGVAHDSIVCAGAIISGGSVTRTIVGPQTRVNSYAEVEDSIIFARRRTSAGARRSAGRSSTRACSIPEGIRDRLRRGRRPGPRLHRDAQRRGGDRQSGELRAGRWPITSDAPHAS